MESDQPESDGGISMRSGNDDWRQQAEVPTSSETYSELKRVKNITKKGSIMIKEFEDTFRASIENRMRVMFDGQKSQTHVSEQMEMEEAEVSIQDLTDFFNLKFNQISPYFDRKVGLFKGNMP